MNWWTASIGVVCAADIFVGPGETYTTIQSAVAIANASDTIIVRNGIYTENINVAVDNVTIRSENGSANCVVRRASNDHIFEVTADYVTISGFKVGFAGASKAGICLNTADHCTISENNVWNNNYGIFLWASNNNNLTGNTASENFDSGIGIFLDDSNNNNLTGNTASENFDSGIGIFLDDSNNNNLTGNTANSNTDYGIYLDASSSNTLTDNTANSNTDYGIYLYDSSNNNTLTGNTASNTGVGGVGIYLLDSINNRIYNNYFSNTQNAWDTGNTGNNVWNTSMAEGPNIIGGPSLGGNYWSDYTGEDLDHDCLGDTPYNVPIVSFDYLPLLLPYTHTDVGVTVTIELSEPGEIEPLLPPDTDLSNALVINVNVIDDTPGNQTNPAYTDITIYLSELDVATFRVYKEGFGFLPEVDDVTTLPTVKPPGNASVSRDLTNNSVIVRLYVGDPLLGVLPPAMWAPSALDTGFGTYPSISGTHNGTIKLNQTITVSKLYTYPCIGTGGHTESIKIWNSTDWNVTAAWDGYVGDWHNLTFNNSFTLYANETYNYTIRTGSYPQIIHAPEYNATGGVITCIEFVDVNGKQHEWWIPAIRLS